MIFSVSNFENGERVDVAARRRLRQLAKMEPTAHFYVNFSGGKDSTAMLLLAIQELPAERLHVMFYDLESETPDTYEFVRTVYRWCLKRRIDFQWNYGQWMVRNATWQHGHGLFMAYGALPKLNIPPYDVLMAKDYGHKTITYCRDRILQDYSDTYSRIAISLIGITKFESLHRLLATTKKRKGNWQDLPWTTIQSTKTGGLSKLTIKAYPIFDWRADDVWGFLQGQSPWGLNQFYIKMHNATGQPISKIRTENVLHGCGLKNLPIIQQLYPRFYGRMVERGLIGNEWGNKHAGEGLPRQKSDGKLAVEKWQNLL